MPQRSLSVRALAMENNDVSQLLNNDQKPQDRSKNGFIFLEVLVAMSLMMTSWMTLMQSYQSLSLKLMQLEQQRAKFRREWSASEISFISKTLSSESSRMSSRSRNLHDPSQSNAQIKR